MHPFPWTRKASFALLALLAGAFLSLPWLVHPHFDATNDGAVYILTAKAMLSGEGYAYLGLPFTLRPPGFSALLAPVLAAAGTNFTALNLLVSLTGVACAALFYVWARPRLGTAVSFALAAALWLNPGFERLATQVMSDVPGAALMLASLVVERWARGKPSPARDALLGVTIAAAAYFRTVFAFLLPAILVHRALSWWREGESRAPLPGFAARRLAAPTLVVAALLLPWAWRNAAVTPAGPAEHTWNHSYWVSLLHEDRGDPASPLVGVGELRRTTKRRAGEILTGLGGRLHTEQASTARSVLGIAGLVCLVSVLLRRREPAEIFGFILFVVLALYYSNRPRLVLPLYVLVLAAAADTAAAALGRFRSPRLAHAAVAIVLLAVALHDAAPFADRADIARRDQRMTSLAAYLSRRYPPGTVFAAENGAVYSVYLGRPVFNFGPVCRRSGKEGLDAYVKRHGIGGLILSPGTDEPCGMEEYLRGRAAVDDSFSPLRIARLD